MVASFFTERISSTDEQMNIDRHRFSFIIRIAILASCCTLIVGGAVQAQAVKYSSRVLLIPLDDRPPCLQFPVKMGLVGDVEVVTPPRELLGRFTDFGKPEEIVEWIRKQNLNSFDGAIVSVDMLAYGGLVASRVYETSSKEALRRVQVVTEMRRKAPRLKIYGSSVIMRLAPTADGKNEAYREKLAKWAEVSADIDEKAETARLEKEIPVEALKNYKLARTRNLEMNRYAVELTGSRVFDYLILSQDDAKPRGVHLADRESLIGFIAANKLNNRVAVQPGADEVSMLLLSRAVSDKYNYHPKIKAIYSSEKLADQVMPFEDRPLRKTVSFHIKASGGVEVSDEKQADIVFYVYASRFEPGVAKSFVETILSGQQSVRNDVAVRLRTAKPFIIADIDPKGDVQGADPVFTEELHRWLVFSKAAGYASWNTAGNTIGTALPHGILFSAIENRFGIPPTRWKMTAAEFNRRNLIQFRVGTAQSWFMLNRLLDDYIYHSVVRPDAIKFSRAKGWNARFDNTQANTIEDYAKSRVFQRANELLNNFAVARFGFSSCTGVDNESFVLPWGRTFEAEIDFTLTCTKIERPSFVTKASKSNENKIFLTNSLRSGDFCRLRPASCKHRPGKFGRSRSEVEDWRHAIDARAPVLQRP